MEAFFLKNAYLRCIGEQPRNALNNKGRLGIIYKGLIHYIVAKHGGVEDTPRIKYQNCTRSPTTEIPYLIKKAGGAHLRSTIKKLPIRSYTIGKTWRIELINLHHHIHHTQSLKLIHTLLLYNIYDIKHLTLSNGTNLMSYKEFKNYYTTPIKLIKQALDTTTQLYCHPSCNINYQNICPNHYPLCILKQRYVTIEHNIEPRDRIASIHPPTPPHPPHPTPPTNIKNNPIRYPIHSIIDHKENTTKQKYKITKK